MKNCALAAPEWLVSSAVYQVNPRTFSPEGTLQAVTAALPALKSWGFQVIYLCPIFEEDESADPGHWSERQHRSQTGNPKNPYRIRDYYQIDPEYGTLSDLRALIDAAHALGQRVLLDLVYAHIGPDAPILRRRPDFARQSAQGDVLYSPWHFPYLDFASPGLREYLWGNMTYYVAALDADGFRCDVGDAVPLDFWAEARRRIRAIKPDAVLINEGNDKKSLRQAFDAMYCFSWHETLYSVYARGESARLLAENWEKNAGDLPAGGLLLRDIDNHDTVTDWPLRTECAAGHAGMEQIEVLNYLLDGIPMVYCGNELGDETTLSMFANRFYPGRFRATDRTIAGEAFSIRRQEIMRALNAWRRESPVLQKGGTRWLSVSAPDAAVAFRRELNGRWVTFVGNASAAPLTVTVEAPLAGKARLENGCHRENERTLRLDGHGYLALENA